MKNRAFFRLMGILLIVLSVAIVFVARDGQSPLDRDITAALLLFPLGIALVFARKIEG